MAKNNKEKNKNSKGSEALTRQGGTPSRDVFSRFFDEDFWSEPFALLRGGPRNASMIGLQFPRVDISETDEEVKVVADIPGVDPDNVDIEVEGNRMKISGFSEREEESDEKPYRYERSYGEFQRVFTLPSRVNEDEVKAVCKEGVLTITLPKTEDKSDHKIKIEKG